MYKMSVLIVDDDTQWILQLKRQLKEEKIGLTHCSSLSGAVELLKQHRFSAAVICFDLPGLQEHLPGISFRNICPTLLDIIATGRKAETDYPFSPDSEHSDYLQKPLKPQSLVSRLSQLLHEPCPDCHRALLKETVLRKKMETRLRKKIDELQFIDNINKAYLNERSLSEILDMFSTAFRKLSGKGNLSLYTYDPESGRLIREYFSLRYSARRKVEKLLQVTIKESAPVIKPGSVLKSILSSQQSYFTTAPDKIVEIFNEFIEDVSQKKIIYSFLKMLRVKLCGLIPLVADGKVIGIVVFIKPDTILNKDEQQRLERLANHIALALARIKKDNLLKQQKEDLNFLNDMNLALNRGDDLDQIQHLCQQQLKELFDCSGSQLYMFDASSNRLKLKNINLSQTVIAGIEKLCGITLKEIYISLSDETLYGQIFSSARVHVHTEIKTIHRLIEEFIPSIAEPDTPRYRFLQSIIPQITEMIPIKTTVNFPLIFKGIKIGLFDVHRSYPFSEKEIDRLKVIVQSITTVLKKKTDEVAFQKSERERKALINAIPDLIFLVDYRGRFLSYHGNGVTKLYVEPDQFIGKTITEIMPEDVAVQAMDCINKTIRNGENNHFEYALSMNGTTLYFWAQMVKVPENKVLILTRDITPYKTMEIELRHAHRNLESRIEERTASLKKAMDSLSESREKYYSLFSDAHDMINILDTEGIIRDANVSELETLGYAREEYIGHCYLDIIHPDFRSRTRDYLESVSYNHNKELFETCLLTKSGNDIYVEVIITPQYKNGKIYSLRTISRDITARQKAEQRAVKISEDEQRRLGRELHDDIGQDITGIALLSKALEKKVRPGEEEFKKDLQNIINISNRTRKKLRGLAQGLYPAKLEIGGLETALREMAENTEFMHNTACNLLCDPDLGIRKPDEIHIYRIVQEAVSNAVKHSRAGNIKIICRNGQDNVSFSVEDDGIGLGANSHNGEGLGFFIMKNRAKIINAILKINHGKPKGTVIQLHVRKEGNYHDS